MKKDKPLSPKQKKIAAMAEPTDKITGEDFKKMKKAKAGGLMGGGHKNYKMSGRI